MHRVMNEHKLRYGNTVCAALHKSTDMFSEKHCGTELCSSSKAFEYFSICRSHVLSPPSVAPWIPSTGSFGELQNMISGGLRSNMKIWRLLPTSELWQLISWFAFWAFLRSISMGVILKSTDFDSVINVPRKKSPNTYKVQQGLKNVDQTGQYSYLLLSLDLRQQLSQLTYRRCKVM